MKLIFIFFLKICLQIGHLSLLFCFKYRSIYFLQKECEFLLLEQFKGFFKSNKHIGQMKSYILYFWIKFSLL